MNKQEQQVRLGSLYRRLGSFEDCNIIILILDDKYDEHGWSAAYKIRQQNYFCGMTSVSGLEKAKEWELLFKPPK